MRYCSVLKYEFCKNGLVRFRAIQGVHDSYLTTVHVSRGEVESFLKTLSVVEAHLGANQLKSFGSVDRIFFWLRKIVFVCEVKEFTHPKYKASLVLYLAKNRFEEMFFLH